MSRSDFELWVDVSIHSVVQNANEAELPALPAESPEPPYINTTLR